MVVVKRCKLTLRSCFAHHLFILRASTAASSAHAFERRYLSALLEKSTGNVSMAARAAGVDRSNFRRLLKQYEVGGRSMGSKDGDNDNEENEEFEGGAASNG